MQISTFLFCILTKKLAFKEKLWDKYTRDVGLYFKFLAEVTV